MNTTERTLPNSAQLCKRNNHSQKIITLTTCIATVLPSPAGLADPQAVVDVIRWDEKAGLRRDAVRSQVIDALEAQEIKETGNEED